jgi:hypothetical protein
VLNMGRPQKGGCHAHQTRANIQRVRVRGGVLYTLGRRPPVLVTPVGEDPRTDQLAARYAGTTRMGKKLAAALTEGSVAYEQATSQAVYRHILPTLSNFPMESVSRRPISPCCSATACGDWRCRARVSACRVRSASRPTDSALKHEGPGRSLSLWG